MRFNKTLVVVVLLFAVMAVAVIDGSSILFAKWQLSDFGDVAASEAAALYATSGDLEEAKAKAQVVLNERQAQAKVTKVTLDSRAGELTFIIKKDASALFVDKISALEDWTHLTTVKTVPIPET